MTIKFEGCFYSFNPPSPAVEMHLPGAGLGGSKIKSDRSHVVLCAKEL